MGHLSISIKTIISFVDFHASLAYLFIFLGVILEGEVVVIFAGIFAYLGSLNPFISFLSVIAGGSARSFLGYLIGFYFHKNHSHRTFFTKVERRISYFLPNFERRPFWSIFISRFFILGIGWFTLMFSGYKCINIRTYIKAEALSLVIWSVAMMWLGYFFGFTALSISNDIRLVLGIILICFISFFVLQNIIAFFIELLESKGNGVSQK